MPFEKVDPQTDFPALERAMLAFWDAKDILGKLQAQNAGKPKWSFLDGPITANNPMGVHHAWGRTYKDVYNRYFAATGHELRYQQGFDCQGLWVEVEVEKELGLKSKRDIESLVPGDVDASINKFVQTCKDRVNKFARIQTEQSIRLGFWMNWDRTDADWAKSPDERHSYFTMAEENNYTIWSYLKKCHHKGLIYRGYDVMPWCGRCGVGISEMEMKEGYKDVAHKAVFVKFPLKDRPGENLLAWTTTPWTLTSNVGAAINPKLTYLKVKLKGEIYYLAKGVFKKNRMESSSDDEDGGTPTGGKKKTRPYLNTIEQMFKSKAGKEGFEIVGEVQGEAMLGWEYVGPFDDLPAQQHEFGFPEEVAQIVKQNAWCRAVSGSAAHKVVSGGDDVSEAEGTGIVHTAPGCGQIDFTWGKENGLPPVAPLDESGNFVPGFGVLTGENAANPAVAEKVFELLKAKDRLFTTEWYVHRYPHCWRCKTELLYRLVDEWFINMGPRNTEEGYRGDIMKVVDKVTFLPESLNGKARERDWLWNMGDWMISKKRFWGLALPIWVDDEDPTQFEVIGSREELKERAVSGWEEFDTHTPHRPWVDRIKIRNPKTGNLMSRVPDVGNPWLDAGIVAFSTMKYNTDRAYWEKWYPADFITESFPGQFRNWFYALLAMSTMMSDGKPPFKNLLGFATVQDQFGKPMHKSDGNSIEFVGAAGDEAARGFELFCDIDPDKPNDVAFKELPRDYLDCREETITDKAGNAKKRVFTRYGPIGADVMRWMYCRHNPANNLNFGPAPANEVRGKFHIKLWNSYAFLVNYARLDGYDPAKNPTVQLQDIDRWILSDLQSLITTAHTAYASFNVMAFCLEAERFLDDRLSNWYIRRNRGRFQSNVGELDATGLADKFAAHQTLHTVLVTFAKLCAPVIPFLAEALYQNLRTPSDPESVHLCPFPVANEKLVDAELSADMNALLNLVTVSGSARSVAKIKVRQPLAELQIETDDLPTRRAAERFAEQLREELNVKATALLPAGSTNLLKATAKLNKKTAAAKLGAKIKEAETWLASCNVKDLDTKLRTGPAEIAGVALVREDFTIEYTAPAGWVHAVERDVKVAIDTRITEVLDFEGIARDIVRLIQDMRKKRDYQIEDRIELYLEASSERTKAAIHKYRDYIETETLTVRAMSKPTEAVVYFPDPRTATDETGMLTIDIKQANGS